MEKLELLRKINRLNEIAAETKKIFVEANEIFAEAKEIVSEIEAFSRDAYYIQYDDIPITEIQLGTKALTTRFQSVCEHNYAGPIKTLGDLLRRSPQEVARYRYMGKTCIEQAQQYIFLAYDVDWK